MEIKQLNNQSLFHEITGKSGERKDEAVLRPTPVTPEDRMNQVMSEELMKNLLSLIVPGRASANNERSVDIKI